MRTAGMIDVWQLETEKEIMLQDRSSTKAMLLHVFHMLCLHAVVPGIS